MNAIMKFSFLILLTSVVANAAPVRDDLVIAATMGGADDGDRETRSTDDGIGGMVEPFDDGTVPWHLDRIDQQNAHLDGRYNPFANGDIATIIT